MSRSYRLILAAARAIIAEADRLDAPKPVPARAFAPATAPEPATDGDPDFDPNDPSLLMNILLPKGMAELFNNLPPGGFDAPSAGLALAEPEPESDPHESYTFACPPVVPELDLNHPAQADYNRVWHDLSTLYSDFHNGGERPAIATAASGVWKSFLALKQYADDPQYPLIRDHLRATVKPACADLIAMCSETGGE